jgi:hypothetical protein
VTEHYYTAAERADQLERVAAAAYELAYALRKSPAEWHWAIPSLEQVRRHARDLLVRGWTCEELQSLADAVPRVIWLHKEWSPPLNLAPDGTFREPAWFGTVDHHHRKLHDAAFELRAIGRY